MTPRLLVPALVALLVSSCASTVQVQSSTSSSGGFGDGGPSQVVDGGTAGSSTGVVGGSGTTVTTVGGATASGGSTRGTGGAPAVGSTTTGATAQGGSAAAPTAVPTKGRGWDATTVKIGVVTQNDAQQAFAAFGAKNVDPGDTNAQVKAVVADINKRGGILGRKVEPVFRDVATLATATNPDTTGQQVCTFFAQDNQVVAVLSIVTVMDYPNFRACLAKYKIPLLTATVKAADDRTAKDLAPYFTQLLGVSWDSLAPVLVNRLQAQGYFSGWDVRLGRASGSKAKVGVVVDGTPTGTRTGKLLERLIEAKGHPTFVYQYDKASDGQSKSVQYFAQNQVTHVIVTDVELTAFQTSAASQQYRPRYGISSYNDPYSNLEASGLTPQGANNGAIGVGWAPNLDVSDANNPANSAGAKRCDAIMAKGGQSFAGNKRLARAIAFAMCDGILLVAAASEAGRGFDGAAFARGVAKVGPAFATANGFTSGLRPGKAFVAGSVRDLAYVTDCSCFRYRGPLTRV